MVVLYGLNKNTMENEDKIKEYSRKIEGAMKEMAPKIELLKAEAEKHKVKLSKELDNCSVSLTESGILVIKFTDIKEAENFYNKL